MSVRILPLPFVPLVLAGLCLATTATAQDRPQVHDVVITFDPVAERVGVSVDPVVVVRGRGDRIVFSAEGVDRWRVSVDEGAPAPFPSRTIEGNAFQSRNVPILPEVAPGTYDYQVAITAGGETYSVGYRIVVRPEEPVESPPPFR